MDFYAETDRVELVLLPSHPIRFDYSSQSHIYPKVTCNTCQSTVVTLTNGAELPTYSIIITI
mgnify:CR=1 FL=1